MTVIFETIKTQSKFNKEIICSDWHISFPFLAVSTGNGVVTVYNEEGEALEVANLSRSSNCTALHWNPSRVMLCTGWKDGILVVYDHIEKTVKEVPQVLHENEITMMKWSDDGTRLITADKSGNVGVWKFDAPSASTSQHVANRLVCDVKYQIGEQVQFIAFKRAQLFKNQTNNENESSMKPQIQSEDYQWLFFIASQSGIVFLADDVAHCERAFSLGSPLAALIYYEQKSSIVALTHSSILAIFSVDDHLKVRQTLKTKINVSSLQQNLNEFSLKALVVGRGMIATCAHEKIVRIWNLDNDDHFVLQSSKIDSSIISICFNHRKRVLACATEKGKIFFFQLMTSESTEDWEEYGQCDAPEGIDSVMWGPGEEILNVNTSQHVYILHETVLKKKMKGKIIVTQMTSDSLILEHIDTPNSKPIPIKCGIKIKDIDINTDYVVISSGKVIELYEFKDQKVSIKCSLDISSRCIAIHNEGVFVAAENKIEVYNFSGTKKQTLILQEEEGIPTGIEVSGSVIAVSTTKNMVKLWQISGREAKPLGDAKQIFDPKDFQDKLEIISIKGNCNGTKISVLSHYVHNEVIREPNHTLIIYDIFQDKLDSFDFKPTGKYPISHFWDGIEPKLFGVEAIRQHVDDEERQSQNDGNHRIEICTLFATQDHGVLMQDSFPLERKFSSLVGISVPSLFLSVKEHAPGALKVVEKKALRDFEGINVRDDDTRDALLNFSYYLTIGNMEEAYKSVKMIKDTSVWHNMARMCVKTKNMDVAEICLGNMEDARAARALRDARKEPEMDARIGMLAVQLGLLSEAEKLYKSCKRYDLLNKMYQSTGKWERALDVAEKNDRIHLRTTHYQYAKYLENIGDFKKAMDHFEYSKNHCYEIPRMLYDTKQIKQLQSYVNSYGSQSPDLLKWWGQYCEGNGKFEEALKYYQTSKDYLSLVRLYCAAGNLKKAAEIASASGNEAACFHLAKHLESQDIIKESIVFYTKSKSFKHAIRLAKERDMEQQVMNLSLQSGADVMVEAAEYFEQKGMEDKAVLLYQKAGNTSRALDLCFKYRLYDSLVQISDNLRGDVDPQLLTKCADFFMQNAKFEKAVQLYVNAGQFDAALDVCMSKNVILTPEMADSMIPDGKKKTNNTDLFKKIAKVASEQCTYELSTKFYVLAGDRIQGMKELIKSGNTEKVIFFAITSRQRELFILAANYLQTLDWQNEPEIMKSIIGFYTKAKAFQHLSNFYEACSQVGIEGIPKNFKPEGNN